MTDQELRDELRRIARANDYPVAAPLVTSLLEAIVITIVLFLLVTLIMLPILALSR